MSVLHLDTETFSDVPLKRGHHAYFEGEQAQIMVATWALDDGPVQCEDLTDVDAAGNVTVRGPSGALVEAITFADEIVIHNSPFDRTGIRKLWGIDIAPSRVFDTMACAMAHSLPGSLGKLCVIMGVPTDEAKDENGQALINLFCKPRPKNVKVRRATKVTHPEEWARFLTYATADIPPMRRLRQDLPKWNFRNTNEHQELNLWRLDQKINDRGFRVDVDLAKRALSTIDREQRKLARQTKLLTGGKEDEDGNITGQDVDKATKRDDLLVHIFVEYGIYLPDLKKDTLERQLLDPEVPDALKQLIRVRLAATTTSTAKYRALLNSVSSDGVLRGTTQFCGAIRTGRWGGRLFQPQNLPRPDMEPGEILAMIEALQSDCLDMVTREVMRALSNMLRGLIIARPGRKLVAADLEQIESRGAAWLAGEQWKLDAITEYDTGAGFDNYVWAYARAFGVTPEAVMANKKANGFWRQVGKVMELACLGADTPVLTDRGLVSITEVCSGDRLWDGVEWVGHDGLVSRGEKATIRLSGIELTPDHLVRTGRTWTQAQQLASCASTHSLALATGSANLPSPGSYTAPRADCSSCSCSARVGLSPIGSTDTICARAPAPGATPAPSSKAAITESSSGPTPISCPTTRTGGDCSTAYRPASIGATTPTTLGSPATAGAASACTSRGARIAAHFSRIWSRWTGGTSRTWSWIARKWTGGMSPATSASSPSARTKATAEPSGGSRIASPSLRPVFDIANAGPRHRFTVMTDDGPLIVHNCGYEGGVAAWLAFAMVYRLDLDALAEDAYPRLPHVAREQAEIIYDWRVKKGIGHFGLGRKTFVVIEAFKTLWRQAHPAMSSYWPELGKAAIEAVQHPKQEVEARKLVFEKRGAWLYMILPSGRRLCYPSPKIKEKGGKDALSYSGVQSFGARKWASIDTYGGKLFENATQAVARDVMAYNMPAIEDAGYPILLTVHDEVITEPADTGDFTTAKLSAILATNPPWMQGCPLAAGGFEDYRYRKD